MKSSVLLSALEGLLCVYKPAELSSSALKKIILKRIFSEGNAAITYAKPPIIKVPLVEAHSETGALIITGEREQMDYMYHPLVTGEEIRIEDIRVEEAQQTETSSSGVCLYGINNYCDELPQFMANSWLNQYRIEGIFGRETLKHEIKGRVTLKADYDHITRHQIAKLLSKIQANYRRMSFETANVDLQSREAFELARKGIPRSQTPGTCLVYSIELESFKAPYFALQLQCTGESDQFLRHFTHEIGVSLGSTASCVRLQRRSFGPFQANHALLEKQLSLQNILRNISFTRKILKQTTTDPDIISSIRSETVDPTDLVDGLGFQESTEEDAMRPAWPRNYN